MFSKVLKQLNKTVEGSSSILPIQMGASYYLVQKNTAYNSSNICCM